VGIMYGRVLRMIKHKQIRDQLVYQLVNQLGDQLCGRLWYNVRESIKND
jgi:hypothetical protein